MTMSPDLTTPALTPGEYDAYQLAYDRGLKAGYIQGQQDGRTTLHREAVAYIQRQRAALEDVVSGHPAVALATLGSVLSWLEANSGNARSALIAAAIDSLHDDADEPKLDEQAAWLADHPPMSL